MNQYERDSMINALMCVLPYPRTWFEGLADKRLKAVYRTNLNKIVQRAIEEDERQVRIKCGLEITPRIEQLTLF